MVRGKRQSVSEGVSVSVGVRSAHYSRVWYRFHHNRSHLHLSAALPTPNPQPSAKKPGGSIYCKLPPAPDRTPQAGGQLPRLRTARKVPPTKAPPRALQVRAGEAGHRAV